MKKKKLLIGLITLIVIIVPLLMTAMVYYICQLIYDLNICLKLILYPVFILSALLFAMFVFYKIEEFFDQIKYHPFGDFTMGYMFGYMYAFFSILLIGLFIKWIITAEGPIVDVPIFNIKIEEPVLFFIMFDGVVLIMMIIQFFRSRKSNKSK